jgi:hypothetical protein
MAHGFMIGPGAESGSMLTAGRHCTLADLPGVHEHDIPLDHLPNQPLHVVLELARRLDLTPATSPRTPPR